MNLINWLATVSKQTKEAQLKHGICYALKALAREGLLLFLDPLEYFFHRKHGSKKYFSLHGKEYQYFYRLFNLTWKNERCAEIPIVWEYVRQSPGKNILELGNVLSYYFPINHDVLDKYEIKPGVINADAVYFKSNKKYDLIVSISTIEHIGWDEPEKDGTKIPKALENLKNLLLPGGKLVVSTSLGYNPNLDKMLKTGELKFSEQYYLKRISKDKWLEVGWDEIKSSSYGKPYPSGNSLIIGIING